MELADLGRLYDVALRYVNEEIGRLIKTAQSESNETVVGFIFNHGDEFRDHGELTHSPQLHEELVHITLLFDLLGSSSVVRPPMPLFDIGPTLLTAISKGTDCGARMCGRRLTTGCAQ